MGKANFRKKVLIVGGGPAGCRQRLSRRRSAGMRSSWPRKAAFWGGLLRFADNDSLKHDLRRYKEFLVRRVQNSNVKVLLNTEPDDELLERYRPDAIIVATGSTPIVPTIPGIETARHATDIYFKPETIQGNDIVMIGGGLVGVEAGLHLRKIGKNVTVLEMLPGYAADARNCYRGGLIRSVGELGLNIVTGAAVKEMMNGAVVYEKDGQSFTVRGDAIFYAVGMRSNEQPYFDLYDKAPFVYEAGDCKKVGKVDGAVHTGFFAALDIGMI